MLATLFWLFACQSAPPPATALLDKIESTAEVRFIGFEDAAAGILGDGGSDLLVWDTRSRALPQEALEPRVIAAVRGFVRRGGGLLLFGFATAYLHALGLEPVAPDRHDTRLMGHSDSFAGGTYEYGLHFLDPTHPLARGLAPHLEAGAAAEGSGPGTARSIFFLAGGPAVRLESCFWEQARPAACTVLATYHRDAYGEERAFAHRCLVERRFGKGLVLACGLGPLGEAGAANAENLRRFVANAIRYVSRGRARNNKPPRVALLPARPAQLGIDTYSSAPPEPRPAAPWHEIDGPLLPYLAHWGWHGQIDYQRKGARPADLTYFAEQIAGESALWGANLLEFYPPDMRSGFPLAWDKDDPVPRPAHYWGGPDFESSWGLETMRTLAEMAHARGMLIHAFFHPNPVRGPLADFVAFGEHTWRDLSNPLFFGWRRSFDGYGSEWPPSDPDASMTSVLWKYNPGTYQHSTAVLPAYTPNFSGTLMCAFGRLARTNACGFSDQWRPLYHPPLYLSYQADCRSKKPSTRDWGGWAHYGGGSWPDWILRQANDFCRERPALDSAIWWLGEPAGTLPARYRDSVYAVSMDPIRGAFTGALTATGRSGYREVIAGQVQGAPAEYISGLPYPETTWLIQNNLFRLYRRSDKDQGILVRDPLRLARFDPDARGNARALELSSDFAHSTLEGWKEKTLHERVALWGIPDGSAGEGRAAGGYLPELPLEIGDMLPRRIVYEADPEWPQRLSLRFESKVGLCRLTIGRIDGGQASLVEVCLDGDPIGFYLSGNPAPSSSFTFGVVEPGEHTLSLQVQDGPGHALDFVAIDRLSNIAVAHASLERGGVRARMREVVARETGDGVSREVRTWTMRADDATLRLDIRREGARGSPLEIHGHGIPVQGPSSTPLRPAPDGGFTIAVPESGVALRFGLGASNDACAVWVAKNGRPRQTFVGSSGTAAAEIEVRAGADGSATAAVGFTRDVIQKLAKRIDAPPRFFVREVDARGAAWWTQRGAQLLHASPDNKTDGGSLLVKAYVREDAPALVRAAAWLPCGFRPGWGCQNVLAIAGDTPQGEAIVRVMKTGPFLFAPRVEFAREVKAIELDGRDWRYLDGRVIFLPNRPGTYRLRVKNRPGRAPSLARTFLDVRSCRWDKGSGTLEIETAPPSWYPHPLPGDKPYTAMILTGGLTLRSIEGARPIPWEAYPVRSSETLAVMRSRGLMLRLKPGVSRIRFEK